MPGWTLIDNHRTQGRTFHRALDELETWLLWKSLFNGTTDGLQHCKLRLRNGSQDAHLFSEANIMRAWVSTKRRYPLAAATVWGADGAPLQFRAATDSKAGGAGGDNGTGFASEPHFVIQEHDLAVLRPREIVFGTVAGEEEAHQRMRAILDGPRLLSADLLMQLHVFREPGRTDVLHLMTLVAHYVSDRLANNTFVRCLLDTLARGGSFEPVQLPLEDRLAMATPSMELVPMHLRSLSPARRRWRRAVGIVIFQLKMAKRQGGHTLPCRLTRSTPHVPGRPCVVSTSLTHAQTTAVMADCRSHDITFGNAYLALAQVAMTRVLYRRYLRGEISEEEWAYRKRQPHISGGPINLRPYLDKTWLAKGGGGEFMFSLGLFFYELPFMTLGKTAEQERSQLRVLSDGAPPFLDLLTFDRFLHRVGLIKKQAVAFFGHPLFFEITRAAALEEIKQTRLDVLQWMRHVETANNHDTHGNSDDEVLAVTDIPMVWALGGFSAGNMNLTSPTEYPLPSTHPLSPYSSVPHPHKAGYFATHLPSPFAFQADTTPKVVVENSGIHLHGRPAELYVSADNSHGRLNMYVIYDSNVFEEGVVTEWLDEMREAIICYLGGTHWMRRAQRSPSDDGQTGHCDGVPAKL